MKIAIFAGAALAFATIGLSACGGTADEAAAVDDGTEQGITVSDGWLALPAVSGNPGVVYFTVHNDGDRDRFLRGVTVDGVGETVLHQTGVPGDEEAMGEIVTVTIPAGGETKFEAGGLHVMAMKLDESLAAGGTAEATISFAGGKGASFPVEVHAAGDPR
jgi:copper(I)-binding protein